MAREMSTPCLFGDSPLVVTRCATYRYVICNTPYRIRITAINGIEASVLFPIAYAPKSGSAAGGQDSTFANRKSEDSWTTSTLGA